jgi:hypothetical protein
VDRFEAPAIAAWQGGVYTARQAVEAGLSRRQVRYRLETGRWHPVVGTAVSVRPPPPQGWPAPALAHKATLTWPDAVIGYQVAGALMGFPIPPSELRGPGHVFSHRKHDRRDGLVGHRRATLPPSVRIPAEGLVLADLRTTLRTTAVDCCSAMPADAALDLYAWLTTRDRLAHTDLGDAVRARFGTHGVARAT